MLQSRSPHLWRKLFNNYLLMSNEGEEYLYEMLFGGKASRDVLKPMAGNPDKLLVSNLPILPLTRLARHVTNC
jgi:hypothetical protein